MMEDAQQEARYALLSLILLLLVLLNGCASIPYDYPRTFSTGLYPPETAATTLGKEIHPQVVKHHGASGFHLLASGMDAFLARVLLINAAEKTLDMQYYIFHTDTTGKVMLDRILAAAERGVRVRLLLDDWRQTAELDRWLTIMELYPNLEVRVFNPFGGLRANPLNRPLQAIFGPERLRARMHNKMFIVDNSVAIVGGRNIGDEYFGASSDVDFRDLDVLALGPIIRPQSAVFDNYWNCAISIPLKALVSYRPGVKDLEEARRRLRADRESLKDSSYGVEMQKSDFLKRMVDGRLRFIWASAEVLADAPLKLSFAPNSKRPVEMAKEIRNFLESARQELLIITPYFVPGRGGVAWFKKMRDRGITPEVVTNSFASTDAVVAQFGYSRYRKALLRMGVVLYELKPTAAARQSGVFSPASGSASSRGAAGESHPCLHAKLLILDRQAIFVGSFNLDPRSAKFDTENGLIIHSPELAAQAVRLFAKDSSPTRSYHVTLKDNDGLVWTTEEQGREVRYYHEPQAPFWRRFFWRFITLPIPESML